MSTGTPSLVDAECILESRDGHTVGLIVRETAAQYIVVQTLPTASGEIRYSKKNLSRIGNRDIWNQRRISFEDVMARKAFLVETYHKRALAARFQGMNWPVLSLAKLLEIKAIIERPEA